MMDAPTLIVPVALDALSASRSVLCRDSFRRWEFAYPDLDYFDSPEPTATDRGTGPVQPGVYLHWVLPAALRHATQDHATGAIDYPVVPNRWLVARFTWTPALQATAWVVESDCPAEDPQWSSLYLVSPDVAASWAASADSLRRAWTAPPGPKGPVASLGRAFALADWTERDAASRGFLTAVAPGNAAFSIYTPHNRSVFSFYDGMHGVTAGAVSYLVAGWYSNPADDPLAVWQNNTRDDDPYDALLARLGWAVAGQPAGEPTPPSARATRSIYEGLALNVAWDPDGSPPDGDPLDALRHSKAVDVAIANTTIDAFTALVAANDPNVGTGGLTLLRAFQYDLLQTLDQPNGSALLARQIRQAWFGSKPGGYEWTIVGADDGQPSPARTGPEEQWLADLNEAQWKLDHALGELADLQWRVHELWWKVGKWGEGPFTPTDRFTLQGLKNQLDPSYTDDHGSPSALARLIAQLGHVQSLAAAVPQPVAAADSPEDAFRDGVNGFARTKSLDSAKVLKAVEAPRMWRANDPVVVISGVEPPDESGLATTLSVRLAGDVVAHLVVDGAPLGPDGAPALDATGMPALIAALVAEWFLLDTQNAALIAHTASRLQADVAAAMETRAAPAYPDRLPALGLQAWTQPWQPMYVEWKTTYVPIPATDGAGRSLWAFDGYDYHYEPGGSSPVPPSQTAGAIALLSPHAQIVLEARLADFIEKYGPDPELSALQREVFGGQAGNRYLTQSLSGFTEQLGLRDQRSYRRPAHGDQLGGESVADITGYPGAGTGPGSLADRYRGAVASVPWMTADRATPFQSMRQGQLYVSYLVLYDKFGRVLPLILGDGTGLYDGTNFPAVIDSPLVPTEKAAGLEGVASVVEVPPRLVQPARLDFELRDTADPTKVLGRAAGVDPVGGWVIPNHLDHSLLLYAPDGTALGDLRLVVDATGAKTARWAGPPHSNVVTMADVVKKAPLVAAVIGAAGIATAPAFDALLDVIDTTLWTTSPLGTRRDQNMSVLVGRPLALVRAGLTLALDGPAVRDVSWDATLEPPEPAVLSQVFSVRLGDLATRDDGLVGFFAQDDYEAFNSVAAPAETTPQGYVRPIGAANWLSLRPVEPPLPALPTQLLTLLVDPRAGVHVTSGILPVTRVDLPAAFVDGALAAMEVTFRLAPTLTYVQPTPVQEGQTPVNTNAVVLSAPAEQNGAWSFWDAEPTGWTGYDIVAALTDAQLKPYPPSLRDGRLQFITDTGTDSE